ncbi:hypothetical protein glysoja_002596, partial [Glycine soja]
SIPFGINPSDSKGKEPSFLDENGVVNDMEGYLDYDSVWDTKPSCKLAWLFILSRILFMCQPWTIALTGVSIIAISWLFLHSVIITSLISSLICAWCKIHIIFLVCCQAYSDMIAERREKVTNGVENTFGQRKNQ